MQKASQTYISWFVRLVFWWRRRTHHFMRTSRGVALLTYEENDWVACMKSICCLSLLLVLGLQPWVKGDESGQGEWTQREWKKTAERSSWSGRLVNTASGHDSSTPVHPSHLWIVQAHIEQSMMGLKPRVEVSLSTDAGHLKEWRWASCGSTVSTIKSDDICPAYAKERFHKYVCIFLCVAAFPLSRACIQLSKGLPSSSLPWQLTVKSITPFSCFVAFFRRPDPLSPLNTGCTISCPWIRHKNAMKHAGKTSIGDKSWTTAAPPHLHLRPRQPWLLHYRQRSSHPLRLKCF